LQCSPHAVSSTFPSAKKECHPPRALCPAQMLCGHPKRQTILCALTQKDLVHSCHQPPKRPACTNRPEVNQTKPEHSAHAEDLCR